MSNSKHTKYSNEDGSGGYNDLAVTGTTDVVVLQAQLPDYYSNIYLDTLFLYFTTLSAATQFTITLSSDSAGDELIVPTFTTGAGGVPALSTGITTAADGTVIVKLSSLVPRIGSLSSIYLNISSDGTATLAKAYISAEVF